MAAQMTFDQWWNSEAADAFRAQHPDMDGEQFRPVWSAAIAASPCASKIHETVGDIRYFLHEAWGFASMSPRGKENIASALDLLDEIDTAS